MYINDRQYGHRQYQNLPKDEKQRLVSIEKNIKCGKIKNAS